jgi:protein-S-isoprenylcysteine O-methyltransferase Ste14
MSEQTSDHSNVVVFPPVVPIATIALGFALQWAFPLGLLVQFDQVDRVVIGLGLFVIGALISSSGSVTLARSATNVLPSKPTLKIVSKGIYGWTRNPIYVGGSFAMVGIAVAFALDWLVLLQIPAHLILHYGIIRREERYLEQKFGEEYRSYKARVPRYLLINV